LTKSTKYVGVVIAEWEVGKWGSGEKGVTVYHISQYTRVWASGKNKNNLLTTDS
jgi:hypothetical protein